eukprot:TRINITY_DN29422_c0_g1_i1.p2 TRINITY_DN29422_c0_g1~~TRINITY_DN29422_c0_g1_i1.p2  ORF type:complete len:381 (-),score=65.59 TRINITY_DN29422_c0_g1_i1:1835-2977(-)
MTAQNGNIRLILKLVLAAAVVGAIGVFALQRFSDPVVVSPVIRGPAVSAVPGSIEVSADQGGIRPFKAESSGRVEWCEALTPDARFKKGDVLMKLDTSDLVREIAETKRNFDFAQEERARLVAANIEKEVAEENLANMKRGLQRGDVSEEVVKTARRALDAIVSKQGIEEARNEKAKADYAALMKTKDIQLDRMTLVAQEDGIVKDVMVWTGALISAGAPVATFVSNKRLVAAKVSEENFGAIRLGQKAKVRLLSYPGEAPFDAVVSKILSVADETTQRYTVYVDVAIDPARLIHGSTGQVTITVGRRENALLVPRRALFNSDNVFVVKDGRVKVQQIKLGYLDLNRAEVLEGLKEGDLVVVENIDQFRDGQRVRVPTTK